MTRSEFINKFKDVVLRASSGTGLFPSVFMAQAILESGNGNSELTKLYNNYFGIKTSPDWKGKTVAYSSGIYRVYDKPIDSFNDRVDFLFKQPRYAAHGVFDAKTPEEQIKALKAAGYAEDAGYVDKIMNIINTNNLKDLDKIQSKTRKIKLILGLAIAAGLITAGILLATKK